MHCRISQRGSIRSSVVRKEKAPEPEAFSNPQQKSTYISASTGAVVRSTTWNVFMTTSEKKRFWPSFAR